jgi:hypothetical protein
MSGATTTIVCPECGHIFSLSDAVRAEVDELVSARYNQELAELRAAAEAETRAAVLEEVAVELTAAREALGESETQARADHDELVGLRRELRKERRCRERAELEFERRLLETHDAIRREEREAAAEEHRMKELEAARQLQAAKADADKLRLRLSQGPARNQGATLEADLVDQLSRAFSGDEIALVRVGQRGGDIVQVVRTANGTACGSILWEAKNTRQWQNTWLHKLRTDMRAAGADHAVLVSVHTPDHIGSMGHLEGTMWGARPVGVSALASVLRRWILEAFAANELARNNGERALALHRYFTGPDFRQRMERLNEFLAEQEAELTAERRWFTQRWARLELRIRAVVDNLAGFSGDLEGLSPGRFDPPAIGPADEQEAS